ncbi:hypothetical protein CSOJ01_13839 [Colletotrichum sojae]|uniref:Uncharacterized protein n=1 Tax=Colletotrichum sojae TaxID=2175907 RepID=A0A8H6IRE1_9PEZI|nr:hypothetical protein CSOJ01_13839 [Colletotrichum sojae]
MRVAAEDIRHTERYEPAIIRTSSTSTDHQQHHHRPTSGPPRVLNRKPQQQLTSTDLRGLTSETDDDDDDDDDDDGTMMKTPLSLVTSNEGNQHLSRRAERRSRALPPTAFQGGPITFTSTPESTAPGRPSPVEVSSGTPNHPQNSTESRSPPVMMRAQSLVSRFLVVLGAYDAAMWMTAQGSGVFQAMAESEGEETYAYLAGVMHGIQEYRYVFAFIFFFGHFVLAGRR